MKIVIVAPEGGKFDGNRNEVLRQLEEAGHETAFVTRAGGDLRNVMADIRNEEPDLLVTENLEGFEMCTLTDAVSYNLVHCRQLHFVFSGGLICEKYLAKQLSLLMTFVCADAELTKSLLSKYADIPEIISMEDGYPNDEMLDRIVRIAACI